MKIHGFYPWIIIVNTFLNGENGISNNFKNGMKVTYSNSAVTVDSGVACIQGRFVEEDTSTPIPIGTDNSYCKLVIEIDLDKENTESELNQAYYKIVKSTSNYPELTQTDIVKNNSGIYQFELARFRTSTSGITDFKDTRKFLNFENIYDEIRQHIQDIDNGTLYVQKANIAVIKAELTTPQANNSSKSVTKNVNYPSGFNKNNSVVISLMSENAEGGVAKFTPTSSTSIPFISCSYGLSVALQNQNIAITREKMSTAEQSTTAICTVVLMKFNDVEE